MVARARGGKFQVKMIIFVEETEATLTMLPLSGKVELNPHPLPNNEDICCPIEFSALITTSIVAFLLLKTQFKFSKMNLVQTTASYY